MEVNKIYQGDVLEVLRSFPDEYVHCCVTSPPYWGLRDYGIGGQLGLEATPEEYITRMVEIFREVRRVLRSDGTLWLNMGDCYANSKDGAKKMYPGQDKCLVPTQKINGPPNLKPKDLVGVPWMLAFALRDDGWGLRSDIIWAKPNPMPESVRDRPTKAHEYMFLLSKSKKYYYDQEAVREAPADTIYTRERYKYKPSKARKRENCKDTNWSNEDLTNNFGNPSGRNLRDVWTIATQPFPEAHFATFPEKLVEPCIKAGTSEKGCCPVCGKGWRRMVEKKRSFESGSGKSGNLPMGKNGPALQGGGETIDIRRGPCLQITTVNFQPGCDCGVNATSPAIVLDPFMGSGTTALVARKLGRNYIGIELNPEYIAIAEKRLQQKFLF